MKKIFTLFTMLLTAAIVNAQTVYLKGVLQGAQEVPATATGAGGVVIVRYNTATNFLELWGNYRALSSTINGSHIHGPAAPGTNAPVLFNLTNTGGTDGGLTGSATLTDAQEADLIGGLLYVNVHSQTFAGGEIRTQLTRVTQDKAVLLNGRLQGAQETPPVNSPGTGTTNVLIDTASHTLWLTSTFSNLTSIANNAHIHTARPHVAGPVSVFVKFTPATSGSMDTSRVISTQIEADILAGNTYLNLHSTTFPGGELRAQILQSTTLRFFAGVLQASQEVPPPQIATGRGTVIVRYNTESNLLELMGDYQNLTANISASHIHGPAPVGVNANPLFDLVNTGGTMGRLTLTRTLTEDQEIQLLAGNWYANVHTPNNPNGEVRAQLIPLSSGETQYLTASLNVDEERAAFPTSTIVSEGFGTAVAVLDKITRNIYLTGSYFNLSSGITNAHIHRGPAAVSGPVSIQLQYMAGTMSGTITGSATNIRATLMDSIINGNSYVNIHSTNYGNGEIRGQLGNLVLPVKLKSFNGYKDQNKAVLTWQTSEELNLKGYQVEEQNMATGKWVSKGWVAAKGLTTPSAYSFEDMPLEASNNVVLYRLKMEDFDGKTSYSPVVRISFSKAKAELRILSNPIEKGTLRFVLTGTTSNKKADVAVIDNNGRIVVRSIANSLSTNNLDISNLAPGLYKLLIKTEDVQLVKSFIK